MKSCIALFHSRALCPSFSVFGLRTDFVVVFRCRTIVGSRSIRFISSRVPRRHLFITHSARVCVFPRGEFAGVVSLGSISESRSWNLLVRRLVSFGHDIACGLHRRPDAHNLATAV